MCTRTDHAMAKPCAGRGGWPVRRGQGRDAIPSLACRARKGCSNPLLLTPLRFAPESRAPRFYPTGGRAALSFMEWPAPPSGVVGSRRIRRRKGWISLCLASTSARTSAAWLGWMRPGFIDSAHCIVDGHYPRATLRALSPRSAPGPGGLRRRLTSFVVGGVLTSRQNSGRRTSAPWR